MARAAGTDSQLIDGAQRREPTRSSYFLGSSYVISLMAAAVAVGLVLVLSLTMGEEDLVTSGVLLAAWAGLMVLADASRYSLVMSANFVASTKTSAAYLAGTGIAAAAVATFGTDVVVVAVLVLTLVTAFGGYQALRALGAARHPRFPVRLSIGLGAEAAYVGIGTQLAPLILFALGAVAETTGLRLAYSVVYAPLFALVQALYPILVLRVLDTADPKHSGAKVVRPWIVGVMAGTSLSALVGYALAWSGMEFIPLSDIVPFLFPVGIAFFGGQIIEVGLLLQRLRWPPWKMNALRLMTVSVEIAVSVVAAATLGVTGVIGAMIAVGIAKIALATGFLVSARRNIS